MYNLGMNSPTRSEQLESAADGLLTRTILLTRLLVREVGGPLSRAELGLLRCLIDSPRRITELAELEGIAQPTATQLVKRLEAQGLVTRERQTDDQRVVLVELTEAGESTYERARRQAIAALRTHLEELSDDELTALGEGLDALQNLITVMLDAPRALEAAL
jgi:DNA-binding MarR family transcriptional regulator